MASNLLWAQLLRKDATSSTTTDALGPSQIPPIAVQDKTGTTMRMLIHDTQANLEKFSTRLDGLLQRVDDCRSQVVNATKLLDAEHDKVLSETLEIAHRCQSEMKTHVGTPAQAAALDLLHVSQVSTDKSVQALEKRIDALQALLQTNVHAMQSIQEQQNTLIGAVMPLVPLLHGVAPQMDQIKAALSDVVTSAASTLTNNIESVRSTLVAEIAHEYGRAGSLTWLGTSSKSTSSRRKRSDTSVSQEVYAPVSSPLDCRGHQFSLKRARVDGTHAGDAQLPCELSRLTVPPTNSGDPPSQQTNTTPRRPLADLPVIPDGNTSRVHHGRTNSISCAYMRHRKTIQAPALEPRNARPLTSRRPIHSLHRRHSAGRQDIPFTVNQSPVGLPNTAGPSDQDPLCKAFKTEEIVVPMLTDVISIHSSPLSSPPSSLPPLNTNTVQYSKLQDHVGDISQAERDLVPLPPSSSDIAGASPPKSMSLRDRLAQMSRIGRRETRRFIALGPWSDEEE